MVRYLITGAAGFIGSHLVEFLVNKADTDVIAIDNLSTGKLSNLAPFLDRITFIEGDITDFTQLRKAMPGVDYVLHQAALPSVPRSISDPEASNWNNVNGTLNVLIASRDSQVKRVVFASSSSVYGADPSLPKKETHSTIPKSPYALTKLAGEHYCRIFYEVFGLQTVALRYFNVFGPRQNPFSQYSAVIPQFISKLISQQKPEIHGDGLQSRDFTYISNVIAANIHACTAERAPGNVFNIGCGSQTSINELFSFLCDELNISLEPVYSNSRSGDVRHSFADISKARELLGYDPDVSVRQGLTETVAYYISTL